MSTSINKTPAVSFRLEKDYPLAKLTTFGIGGPADWAAFCNTPEQVVEAVGYCSRNQIDYFVLGGGSNVLASDQGYRGMIILPRIDFLRYEGEIVSAGAAYSLAKMIDEVCAAGLSGLESMAGIAGQVGGAIVGNAGAYGQSISDRLIDVDLYHPAQGRYTALPGQLGFRYRHSDLKWSKNIVLSARFKLERSDATALVKKAKEICDLRWTRHPHEDVSAGCFFKNIEDKSAPHGKIPAGQLLDEIGAKQITVGNAGVYPNHANILINKGGATASDVRRLSLLLKQKVKETYGLELSEEVILLGDFS